MPQRLAPLVCMALAMAPFPAITGVRIIVGPTPIVHGQASAAHDITIVNEKLAFALAVESPVPYGVPRGAIIDIAPVKDGVIGRDCVVFADFIPNNWSAWPNTYQHVEILENTAVRAVIRSVRDWGSVVISTTYTVLANADTVNISTVMRNDGETLAGLLSGMTLWPSQGYLFAVPGLAGLEHGATTNALSDRVVAYDTNWSVTLHAAYADHIGDGSKDLYLEHTLDAGASRVFEAVLQVGSSGDLAPVLANEIARHEQFNGRIHGQVFDADGKIVGQPLVVVEKAKTPYAWAQGRQGLFDLRLPRGPYIVYATAKGYSQSTPVAVDVGDQTDAQLDFRNLASAGHLRVDVANARTGKAMDARIDVTSGQRPVVQFLGRNTFFTEFRRKGVLDTEMPPGHYVLTVSSGGGFLSPAQRIDVDIKSGLTTSARVAIVQQIEPRASHWFAADLHHHADQAEAVTPPEDLARSQLAAGLDLLFVSDHDSTVNHRSLQAMAQARGIPFIPAIELSASWGHFNAYPLRLGQALAIDTATATVQEIFAEARRQGARIIQVNHPFIPYGYLPSVRDSLAPGGFDPDFDLLEINASAPEDDLRVLHTLWDYWNHGQRYYLAAGTDTHDVWNDHLGAMRTYANVEGAVTAGKYAVALKAGHAYVTSGPIILPAVMFGSTLHARKGRPVHLSFVLKSIAGLKRVELIERGVIVKTATYDDSRHVASFAVDPTVIDATWFSLDAEDTDGHKAFSDPIWVTANE